MTEAIWPLVAIFAIIGLVMIVAIRTAGRLFEAMLWTRRSDEPEYLRPPPGARPRARRPAPTWSLFG